MYRANFFKLVTVAGLLWVSQGNYAQAEQVGLVAQAVNTCQIDSLQKDEDLSPISNPPTGLTGEFSITISCTGNASGNLLLTLNSSSVVYNGGAKMQFVRKSGVLAGANTNPSTSTITVPISSQGNQMGTGSVRVEILAPSGKFLKAANNYQLSVTATFN
jgi:hypothetical protein